jgi:hypothetical protein
VMEGDELREILRAVPPVPVPPASEDTPPV